MFEFDLKKHVLLVQSLVSLIQVVVFRYKFETIGGWDLKCQLFPTLGHYLIVVADKQVLKLQ